MIKYVLLPLAPPAKRDVLQKRRRLIFPVPENWHLCVLRQPWGCAGARSSPHPCPVWYLGLGLAPLLHIPARFGPWCCCGQRLCSHSALSQEVCAAVSSAKWGQKPPCLGSTCCALLLRGYAGVPHPRGLSCGYGRGWGAMGMLGWLHTHGYHCEDALNSKKLSQGGFLHVVHIFLRLLVLFG